MLEKDCKSATIAKYMKTQIIILAAGHGKRMQSEIPKALTPLNGKPFIEHILDTIESSGVCDKPVIVIGQKGDYIREALGDGYTYAVQKEQLGTGHAVLSAKESVNPENDITLVISADQPTISMQTIQNIIKTHIEKTPTITIGTVVVPDFKDWRVGLYTNFGRIIRDSDGSVKKITEFKDATEDEKRIKELNPALYAFDTKWLWKNIDSLKNENAQGEYYLTDLIKIACDQSKKIEAVPVSNIIEGLQPNSKAELEILEKILITNT